MSQLPSLQVYRSYYDNPSGTPYAVGAAGSPDYVQEYIVEKFEADCNQVGISEIFQPFLWLALFTQGFVIPAHDSSKKNEEAEEDVSQESTNEVGLKCPPNVSIRWNYFQAPGSSSSSSMVSGGGSGKGSSVPVRFLKNTD